MTNTPVDMEAALLWYRRQAVDMQVPAELHSNTWLNYCQAAAHYAYQVGSGNGSAYAQWLATSPEHRHPTTNLHSAPVGSFMCTKGSSPFGHIFIAAHPFKDGHDGGWSNDLVVAGNIDKVAREAPHLIWGHRNLGWIEEINGFVLDLTHGKPPKPIENKRYKRIARSINLLEGALETARKDGDRGDIRLIKEEIAAQKDLYGKIKHS